MSTQTASPTQKETKFKGVDTADQKDFEEMLKRLVIERGYLTQEQLEDCQREQIVMEGLGARQAIGQICLRREFLSQKQVQEILREFHYEKIRKEDIEIGRLAVEKDYVSSKDIDGCLRIQERAYKRGRASIPRLAHILGDRDLLRGPKVVDLLESVYQVERNGRRLSQTMEQLASNQPQPRKDRQEPRRLMDRDSERFGVPDACVIYRTGFLESFKDVDEQSPLIDISLTGIQFLTRRDLKIGQKVKGQLMAPAFNDKISFKGEVRWVDRAGLSEFYRIGVQFTGSNKEIRTYIEKLMDDPFLRAMGRSPYRMY